MDRRGSGLFNVPSRPEHRKQRKRDDGQARVMSRKFRKASLLGGGRGLILGTGLVERDVFGSGHFNFRRKFVEVYLLSILRF